MPHSKHQNDGACRRCVEIKDRFPDFHPYLWAWFVGVQKSIPDFHISCAGRGEEEQEMLYMKKASRAHWKRSAHNWGAALDTFFMGDLHNLWPSRRYDNLKTFGKIPPTINWYGDVGSTFPELPHFEVRNWRTLRDQGALKLCETPSSIK